MKKFILILVVLAAFFYFGDGRSGIDSYNEEFVENYSYLTENLWLWQDGVTVVTVGFLSEGRDEKERNFHGSMIMQPMVAQSSMVWLEYEVVNIIDPDKFVLRITGTGDKEEITVKIDRYNNVINGKFSNGSTCEWYIQK